MRSLQPQLGMGTWGMGGTYERDESTIDRSLEVLREGLSSGLKIIDTAELYGAGLCEEIVGRAIRERSRKSVYVISKVWKTNLRYDDVLRAADRSLKRLGVDYIDLYLVHWPNPEIPVQETMRAMERLQKSGVVRSIGVSNFSVQDMQAARAALESASLAADQVEFSVTKQSARVSIVPFCKQHAIDVIAYMPLARGAASKDPKVLSLANKYGKTPNQIALNWLIMQDTLPIPATLDPAHLHENMGALDFTLSPEDVSFLCSD